MKKVGMYGGKFYPMPHQGHVYCMTIASTMVDELHIIVSYDDEFEQNILSENSKIPHVGFKQRVRWWREITKHLPHVFVHAVEETNDGNFESWQKGAEGIKNAIGKPINYIFSSEKSYTKFFNKLYLESTHIVIDEDRNEYNISGTRLRDEGVYKNWDMIPNVVKPYFVKKVVIVGVESTGKSILTQNLAKLYNTNFVEEHGRAFYDELNSYETFEEDFLKIAYRHKYFEEQALKKSNKILFIDTEATVTEKFMKIYHGKYDETLQYIQKNQQYDLWLFLESDVNWVDDGTRTLGDEEKRFEDNRLLKSMLSSNGINYKILTGSYLLRLHKSMENIDELFE